MFSLQERKYKMFTLSTRSESWWMLRNRRWNQEEMCHSVSLGFYWSCLQFLLTLPCTSHFPWLAWVMGSRCPAQTLQVSIGLGRRLNMSFDAHDIFLASFSLRWYFFLCTRYLQTSPACWAPCAGSGACRFIYAGCKDPERTRWIKQSVKVVFQVLRWDRSEQRWVGLPGSHGWNSLITVQSVVRALLTQHQTFIGSLTLMSGHCDKCLQFYFLPLQQSLGLLAAIIREGCNYFKSKKCLI